MMFPPLYDAHHQNYQEDLPFWLGLARQQGSPFLELGCGTGRVLLALQQAGFQGWGLDLDPTMLAWLRNKLPQRARQNAPVFLADMSQFHLAIRFPLILLPCNTLSILTPSQRGCLYARVRRHLAPGGLFAASLPNPDYLRMLPRRGKNEVEEIFTHPISGNPVQVSNAWQRRVDTLQVTWHYDHLLPDGTVQRHTVEVQHSLALVASYSQELQAQGLQMEALFGDFDYSPYQPDSEYLIFLARIQ